MADLPELGARFGRLRTDSESRPVARPADASLTKDNPPPNVRSRRRRKAKPSTANPRVSSLGEISARSVSSIPREPAGNRIISGRLRPRGFQNYKNSCYLNVTLQTLLHIPPFVRLFQELSCSDETQTSPENLNGGTKNTDSLCEAILDLISQFVPESKLASGDSAQSTTPSKSDSTATTIPASTRAKGNTSCERVLGRGLIPFELGPSITLDDRFSRLLELSGGLQEDGAECLTRLLSRLHEELGKTQDSKPGSTSTGLENGVQDDSCEWIVTDRSGKRRPQARMTELQGGPSRIADLFSGVLITRSTVKHSDRLYTRPPTITSVDKLTRKATCLSTQEPFFILPLDINSPKVTNIESALSCLTESELITDYQDATTGQSSHVNQRLILHRLPPYLLLQLKRFSYGPQPIQSNNSLPLGQWTVEKSLKQLSISLELFIPPKLLSHETTFSKDERHYFLRAVLFHVGRTAASGHYTVAVRWMDDSRVQSTSESDWQFLYLDDTRACLVQGSEAVRTLLSSHLPLDTNSCLFYNLPRDIPSHTTSAIMKQPRTPYVLIYEATTQLHSHAVA
ncbi:hypothetical protein EG68_10487 [Paragonimus skrjabini miyazakii]|uniref:ubiquitinyl hydrolase 1 n=1 Tax=Paragonimus skrjabini miyazakii TaxID=59628 RepID=A0A8S9Y9B2_9TREM|nr:hypothetical protein EG68_10487 [Paragonimus skrjabini miyazakii]